MTRHAGLRAGLLRLASFATSLAACATAFAAVTPEEAGTLGNTLTPIGAEGRFMSGQPAVLP